VKPENCAVVQSFRELPPQASECKRGNYNSGAPEEVLLNPSAAQWHLCRVSSEIVDRARRSLPVEPAVHWTQFTRHQHWPYVPLSRVLNFSEMSYADATRAAVF